jgi:hypothetical protein
MLGRPLYLISTILLLAGFLAVAALPVVADEVYSLDKDFYRANSNIIIHLKYVSVTDKYMGNIYPSKAPQDTKWAHLVYQYENTGDKTEVGSIQYEFIDTKGNVYRFNPNLDEYSGVTVGPHSVSDIRWNEIPIPRDTVLAKVHVFEGTNPSFLLANETYELHLESGSYPTATIVPSSGGPTSGTGRCCAPLLPFAIIASLGIAGLYIKGKGAKK